VKVKYLFKLTAYVKVKILFRIDCGDGVVWVDIGLTSYRATIEDEYGIGHVFR
jgi:hypothetical protein